ncbi:MAG: NAD(P)-binding protein [Cyanobacteria bacterium REEB417]|nr:NAD(P)-binding protein [Cyanobacteria bacterium REEB417]
MERPTSRTDRQVDLAIVGAGVAACSLVAALRQRCWAGSIVLLESGRGPGGRAATRRSRHDPGMAINHGAPLFNTLAPELPPLLSALAQEGWIGPFDGAILSLNGQGRIGPALHDGFSDGALWQGNGGMDQLATGLLALAGRQSGPTLLRGGTLVRDLIPIAADGLAGWQLQAPDGTALARCRWLVLSGTLLAHPRCRSMLGWDAVPLQQAAARLGDRQLDQAVTALAAVQTGASSNLLLNLPPELSPIWQRQLWRLLQFTPEAQQRWGLRRVSLQPQAEERWAVVAESSTAFAECHRHVHGSRSSVAQLLGAPADPKGEGAVLHALEQALQNALGLPTAGAERQLMRWGAAFPQPPGLPAALQLCPSSRIGFCGDVMASAGFGRIEGAVTSASALAEQLLPLL